MQSIKRYLPWLDNVHLSPYIRLSRLDRPVGIYLLLWPTLWALWLAAEGAPDLKHLFIFILGCILMRSAGCIINDLSDRNLDGHVARTKLRPLVTGEVTPKQALITAIILTLLAFALVLFTNGLTIKLSFVAVALAIIYPLMKRFTNLPQVILGAAFACSVPMAFAAVTAELQVNAWLLYCIVLLWTVTYDTFYGMVDRDDDLKVGIKSTAILLGDMDRVGTASLQILTVLSLFLLGPNFGLGWFYYCSLVIVAALFVYQQLLIKERDKNGCFAAFLNNNWVGMTVFIGIFGHYAMTAPVS